MPLSTPAKIGLAATTTAALVAVGIAWVRSDTIYKQGTPPTIAQVPLYLKDAIPPLNMLVMGKDHKIYYEAYNDASDLNGDGGLDVGYKPATINYYGYFNSNACYTYDAGSGRFTPQSLASNKQCAAAWSGDFLNYLTTSRMDALRRVLIGGWRQVDTDTDTTLQGAFFPQDAHSWGKEYQSIARDGYDISRYAPLSVPANGKYHLFAVTTVTDGAAPLFRVLQNSDFRVWNWLSIEGPVAGNRCFTSNNTRVDCTTSGTQPFPGHPGSRAAFNTMVTTYAVPANRFGSGSLGRIDCSSNNCNPYGVDDEYLAIIDGELDIRRQRGGTYQFRVDGDDVIDFQLLDGNGNVVASAGCYNASGRGFGACSGAETSAAVALSDTTYRFQFRQEEGQGGDGYRLSWRKTAGGNEFDWRVLTDNRNDADGNGELKNVQLTTYDLTPALAGGTRADYNVRVQVCPDNAALRDETCKVYPNGKAKPTGILHDYGETQKMYFGLITGSQFNNLEGGVLRKNVGNFANEINAQTGQFLAGNGIANTLSKLRMVGGGYNGGTTNNLGSDQNWNWANGTGNCPSIGDRAINNGECRMWGNPIAEMMFEGLRYFAGAGAATARFATGGASQGVTEETSLGLTQDTWKDPYGSGNNGLSYPTCARPYETIISDINPSYDSDLPGSAFSGVSSDPALPSFSAGAQGQTIWNNEFGGARDVFIGEVGGTSDGAPTIKTASSFGNIRGLAPEEPTKQGTYYSASVARFGFLNDINPAANSQKLGVYSIALASPLPRIEFPVGNRMITILPFAKTVSGTFGGAARKPTNTIVDFYVENVVNLPQQPFNASVNGGRGYAVFRINYEDVEQGNDHDMDAIVRYEVLANANGTVTVNLTSEYAAGSADQNIGYVISGTTRDGIYLEVRDRDGPGTPYVLNTPPGANAGDCTGGTASFPCNQALPLNATRTFTAAASAPAATQLNNPLWYAAKYGGFDDINNNGIPEPGEWDKEASGKPDNYFLVTNPLQLRSQLMKAFENIANRDADPGNATVNGARVGAGSFTLQPSFARKRDNNDWTGNLKAVALAPNGTVDATLWDAAGLLPTAATRNIFAATTPGNSSTRIARDFLAANLGTTTDDQFSALGIVTAQVPTRYGASYSPDEIVAYLRGDQSREASQGGTTNTLRSRSARLGDIINSEPVVFSPRSNFGYGDYTDNMFSGYASYLTSKRTRRPLVLVGANDGMLHGFDGSTQPCTADPNLACAAPGAGRELFAFVPNGVLSKMGRLALPDALYEHEYYVDGQTTLGDVKNGASWRSLAVGTTGGGGRSIFALDVTNPASIGPASLAWELNSALDPELGFTFSKPLIVPLENNEWGVLTGNGYGSSTSNPILYLINANTGAIIRKIQADDGALTGAVTDPYNGLGQITAIDRDADGKADTVYGGDLQGNLWKFDISSASPASWGVALGGLPLFIATEGTRTTPYTGPDAALYGRQPITGGIRVAAGPGTGYMVTFGTGRYFAQGDNDVPTTVDPQVQSLYGIWDNNTAVASGRSALVTQTITAQVVNGTLITRSVSQNPVAYFGAAARRGWVMDLALNTDGDTALDGNGERFIATPRIQNGKVFFPTYTPERNSCDPGGTNFMYALDLMSGTGALAFVKQLPSQTAACTNGDCGAIALSTAANAQPPVTSVSAVVPTNPALVPGLGCVPGAPGCPTGPPPFEECQVVIYPGALVLPRPCGRQSWRQLK